MGRKVKVGMGKAKEYVCPHLEAFTRDWEGRRAVTGRENDGKLYWKG